MGGHDAEGAAELAPIPSRRAAPAPPAARAWLAVALVVAAGLYLLRGATPALALGGLLAYVVAPGVALLERRARLPRPVAILAVYAAAGTGLALGIDLLLPGIVAELLRFLGQLPQLAAAAEAHAARLRAGYARLPLPPAVRGAVDAAILRGERAASAAVRDALGAALGLLGAGVAAIVAPVIAYYLLVDAAAVRDGFARLLPPEARTPVLACLADLDAVLAGWIRGQLLLAGAVGALATGALLLLGVRYALTLGFAAALGELIPYFGPIVGAVPAVAVAATGGGLPLALETAAAYLLIQQFEGALLAPRLVGRAVSLHPVAVIAVLLAGERLGGLAGIIVAVPAAAAVRVLARHVVRALTRLQRPRSLT